MEPSGILQIMVWALMAALVVGGGIYGYIEYHAFLLRTRVIEIAGGLRFTAQGLTVETRVPSKDVVVQTRDGRYLHHSAGATEDSVQTGSLTATFPGVGLRLTCSRIVVRGDGDKQSRETGYSTLDFNATDELTCQAKGGTPGEQWSLRIDRVPDPIARDFQQFAHRVHLWIDKLEHGIHVELDKRRQEEEERAKAEAVVAAGLSGKTRDDPSVPLTDAEREARAAAQIANWRAAAGFKGSSTEVSITPRGQIDWLIDLDPTGRVILHGKNRTFHGSLKGARVTALTGELEVGVRDDYWSEDDPQLVEFRVLTGASSESRRAWKERLDILIRSLG